MGIVDKINVKSGMGDENKLIGLEGRVDEDGQKSIKLKSPINEMNETSKEISSRIRDSWEVEKSKVISPTHYGGDIQPLELMQSQMSKEEFQGFLKGNVIKYVSRAGKKFGSSEIEDLSKAKRYLDWLIQSVENKTINPRK